MCGIIGIVSQNGPIHEELEKGMGAITHRGPDKLGRWFGRDGRVGLGHTRLSIIDLATGDQPITDGTNTVVANGEFYDFEAIRSELEKEGFQFTTKSDSEIALHLYKKMGTACLEKLRGEFAFAIWDGRNQTLFAARDRFGIKPLFYTQHKGKLLFASEVKALFAAGVPAIWDEESVLQLCAGMVLHQDRSLFKGIRQIPPGHFLLASKNSMKIQPYWDFNYPEQGKTKNPPMEEAVLETRRLIEESIKLRLRADVEVGCYLSGGLDSCTVLGIANHFSPRPLRAFTLSFGNDSAYDERTIAEEMAKHAGANFEPIPITDQDIVDNFRDSIRHAESVCVNPHGVAKFILSKKVHAAGIKTVMTGEGSDEVFAGYPHFRRDLWLYNSQGQDPAKLAEALEQLKANNSVSQGVVLATQESPKSARIKQMLGFVPSFFETNFQMGEKLGLILQPEMGKRMEERDAAFLFLNELDLSRQVLRRDPVNQSLYLWSKMALPGYILTVLGDRMEMAHSLEGRLPFLDHKLVEYVSQLSINYKINGPSEKFILKEAAKPYVTDTIYKRQKHPFLAPPAAGRDEGPMAEFVRSQMESSNGSRFPFFNDKALAGLSAQLQKIPAAQRGVADPLVMVILSLNMLQEIFRPGTE
ncbi:MAG: asparagine synthase (glutamine-hydrolyzing) [Bdellovibrionota bacterium]